MRLKEKVALVTGASRGIGFAVAELFAREGAIVYAGSTSNPSHIFPSSVTGVELDVSKEEHWKRVVADIVAAHRRLDVLVNNAGIAVYDAVHDCSTENWRKVLGVNQDGCFFGMREVIPHMKAHKAGSIINVSSISGTAAVPGAHAYHATKGAVVMMSKNAAITYAGDGIRVNSIHPGFIDTPLTQAQDPAINAHVIGLTPMFPTELTQRRGRNGPPRKQFPGRERQACLCGAQPSREDKRQLDNRSRFQAGYLRASSELKPHD